MEKFRKQIHPDRKLVEVVLAGTITLEDVLEDFRTALPGIESFSAVNTLIDTSGARLDLGLRAIERIVSFLQDHASVFGGGRWAFVASSDLNYGIARMFQGVSEPTGLAVGIFPDRPQAMVWLGV